MSQVEKLKKSLSDLGDEIADAITVREDEVFVYVGNGCYALDQDGLKRVIKEVLFGKENL